MGANKQLKIKKKALALRIVGNKSVTKQPFLWSCRAFCMQR